MDELGLLSAWHISFINSVNSQINLLKKASGFSCIDEFTDTHTS